VSPEEVAERSAAFLDANLPGWRAHVTREVHMDSIFDCVLSQVGMSMLGLPDKPGTFGNMMDRLEEFTTEADVDWWDSAWANPEENDIWREILGRR